MIVEPRLLARLTSKQLLGIIARERALAHQHRLSEASRPIGSKLRQLDKQGAESCDSFAEAAAAELRRRTEQTYNDALLVAGLERRTKS